MPPTSFIRQNARRQHPFFPRARIYISHSTVNGDVALHSATTSETLAKIPVELLRSSSRNVLAPETDSLLQSDILCRSSHAGATEVVAEAWVGATSLRCGWVAGVALCAVDIDRRGQLCVPVGYVDGYGNRTTYGKGDAASEVPGAVISTRCDGCSGGAGGKGEDGEAHIG